MTTTNHLNVQQRLRLRGEIAKVSDVLYSQVELPVSKLLKAFGDKEGGFDKGLTQVRNLENVAYSTDRLSDIYDLLKKQIGRSDQGKRWRHQGVGQEILDALSGLGREARQIANQVDKDNPDLPRQVHLALIREYVKHLAAHYLYAGVTKE